MPWSRAFILVARRIDTLGDMRGLAVEMVLEVRALPVEAVLLIADLLDGVADDLLDLVAHARRPAMRVSELLFVVRVLAADFAADHDALRRHQRLAGDARFRVLRQEQVHDRVGNLVGDLVGMALGHRFGREEIVGTHRRSCAERGPEPTYKDMFMSARL